MKHFLTAMYILNYRYLVIGACSNLGRVECHQRTSFFHPSYLSWRFDALHEAEEDDQPAAGQRQGQVPLEATEIAELREAGRNVEDVLLPELRRRRLNVGAVLRHVGRVALLQGEEGRVRLIVGGHHAVRVRTPPFTCKRSSGEKNLKPQNIYVDGNICFELSLKKLLLCLFILSNKARSKYVSNPKYMFIPNNMCNYSSDKYIN